MNFFSSIEDLNTSDRQVFGLIQDFTKQYTNIYACCRYIANKLKLHMRTVFRSLKRLLERGFIEGRKRPGKPTIYKVLDWALSIPKNMLSVRGVSGVCQGSVPKGVMYKRNLPTEDLNESKIDNDSDIDLDKVMIEPKKVSGMAQKKTSTDKFKKDTYQNTEQWRFLMEKTPSTSDNLCSVPSMTYVFDKMALKRFCSLPMYLAIAVYERYVHVSSIDRIKNASGWLMSEAAKASRLGKDYLPKCAPIENKEEIKLYPNDNTDYSQKIWDFIDNFQANFKSNHGFKLVNGWPVMFTSYCETQIEFTEQGWNTVKQFYEKNKR